MVSRTLLTVPEFAAQFQLPLPRAYSLVRKGLIPGVVRIGRQVRIDPVRLSQFVEDGGRGLDEKALGSGAVNEP